MHQRIGVLLFWLLCAASISTPATAVNLTTVNDAPYTAQLEILRLDPSEATDLDTARTSDQWQVTEDFGVHGYDAGIYWLKVTLSSLSQDPLKLIVRPVYPLHDRIDFYLFEQNQLLNKWHMGDVLADPNWQFADKSFAIPVELKTQQTLKVFIRIEGMNSKMLKTEIITYEDLQESIHWNRLIFGAIYGIMLAMAIYNLIIGYFVRDKAYIIYACQVAFFCLFIMTINGDGRYYLWTDYPEFNYYAIQTFGVLYVFFLILFPWYLLKLDKYLPNAKYAFYFFWFVEITFAAAVLFLPYEKSMQVAIAISALFSPILFLSGLYFVFRRVPVAGIYTFAWSFYLFGATLVALAASNVVELNIFTLNGGAIGGIIEQVLLSLALAKRIDNERQEKYTALKQVTDSEIEVAKQKRNYKKLFHRSPIGIVTMDKNGNVINMNPKCLELFEIDSDEESINYSAAFYRHFAQHKDITEAVKRDGVLMDYETVFTTNKGNKKHCTVTLIQQTDENRTIFESYITDISERKRDQEIIHAMEQERMKTLEQLVTGMAHEINTPVGTSLTSASFLREGLKEIHDDFSSNKITKSNFSNYINQTEEGLGIINKCLLKIKVLIQRFKQVSFKNIEQEKREMILDEHLNSIFLQSLGQKDIKYEINIQGDTKIKTLPDLFEIILNQLIENSLIHAFTDIQSARINLDVHRVNDHISLLYRDNGKGIDKSLVNQIFNPFVTSNRGDENRAGLGLYRIHNLVTQALNGQIQLIDEPGFALRIEFDL